MLEAKNCSQQEFPMKGMHVRRDQSHLNMSTRDDALLREKQSCLYASVSLLKSLSDVSVFLGFHNKLNFL